MQLLKTPEQHKIIKIEETDFRTHKDLDSIFKVIQHLNGSVVLNPHTAADVGQYLKALESENTPLREETRMKLGMSQYIFIRILEWYQEKRFDRLCLNNVGSLYAGDLIATRLVFQGTPTRVLQVLRGENLTSHAYGVIIHNRFYPCEQGCHFDTLVHATKELGIELTDKFIKEYVRFFPIEI